MRENVTELLKRLENTQKGETICLKYDDVRKILRLLTDHGKTEITGNTLDTETILDGLDHMAVACVGISCDVCRFKNKKKTEPFTCAMDEANIAENAARLIEDQAERIAIMSEGGWCPDWHFFTFRPATNEEKEAYKVIYGEYNEGDAEELQMLENVPGDCEDVFLWNGYGFSVDTYDDGMLEREGEIEEGMAWAYLPKPPKKGEA